MKSALFDTRARVYAAALLCCLISTQAGATVSASASVTNLAWTTAKIDTSIAGASGASLVGTNNNGEFQGLAWLAGSQVLPVTAPGTSQHASQAYGDGNFTGSGTYDSSASGWTLSATSSSTPGLYESSATGTRRGGAGSTIVYSENATSSAPFKGGLLLTANTKITFTGALNGSISVDANDTTSNNIFASATIAANFSAYLNPVGANYFEGFDTGYTALNKSLGVSVVDFANNPSAPRQVSADYGAQPFNFTLSNTTNQAVWVAFRAGAYVTLFQEVTDPYTPNPFPQPSIPEPQTWALMGLGLLGISAAAKRRRA